MQFTGGATASLSMIGFTESVCAREVNVFGTRVIKMSSLPFTSVVICKV